MQNEPQPFLFGNVPLPDAYQLTIWNLLREVGQQRPLRTMEIRLRCACQPRPWRDAGCDRSTWYRRRKRAASPIGAAVDQIT